MMEILREYVEVANANELHDLINVGYEEIYRDVNLSAIYEVLSDGIPEAEAEVQRLIEWIDYHFGYYGQGLLLEVDGVYYWLMQV